ncbi:hypothetical protein R3P38DRAFT_3432923 [Favolaschia claudopus]|uniref:F-box domain-containing protein n=1 Tax=Favolaschia claudopus TaxID=2862362 RepID=A0AAW0CY08_9AGAR
MSTSSSTMSSNNSLPDEIISEILAPALRVPDAAFATMYSADPNGSPFMRFSESSSAYLVVCKAWLRVGTPLLYSVIPLRSRAQAQALANALTANPELGQFIKKLRVEGGFGMSMFKVLQAAPKITDIYLSFDIPMSDNPSGLCRGLHLLNPVRVIVDVHKNDWGFCSVSAGGHRLFDTLKKCVLTWNQMTTFETPLDRHSSLSCRDIIEALVSAPALETLVLWEDSSTVYVPQYLRSVAQNPRLQRIQFRSHSSSSPKRIILDPFIRWDDRWKQVFSFEMQSSPTSFAYPPQLTATPTLEDAIWGRVLDFTFSAPPQWKVRGMPTPSRLSPLLVCKMFARLGQAHLFTHIGLLHQSSLRLLLSRLRRDPSLRPYVRSLHLEDIGDVIARSIAKYTPALREVYANERCPAFGWDTFSELSESVGTSLQSFCGVTIKESPHSCTSSQIFARFPKIQEFHWDSSTVFDVAPTSIPTGGLGSLVTLAIAECHSSFLAVLALMDLPVLQNVVFTCDTADDGVQFFQNHGKKLKELTLSEFQLHDSALAIAQNCPSLTKLGIACDDEHPISASCLTFPEAYAFVKRISFVPSSSYTRLKRPHQTSLTKLFEALPSSASFPALHEIEHSWCEWPTTDAEILKSRWVKWAESLLERNLYLIGPAGIHWRPRLKYVKKSR